MLAYIFRQRSQQKQQCVRSGRRTRWEDGSVLPPQDTARWELRSILLQALKCRAESQNARAGSLSWPWCVWSLLCPQTPSHWWCLWAPTSCWSQSPKDCPVLPMLSNKWHFLPHPPLPAPQSCKQQFNLWAPKEHVHFLAGITKKIERRCLAKCRISVQF